MGTELTEMARELPQSSEADTDPEHGNADDLEALESLQSEFADDETPDEQPDLTDEPAEPESKEEAPEKNPDEKDAADAGHQGEEQPEQEQAAVDEPEPAADPEVLSEPTAEDYDRVSTSMNDALSRLDAGLRERVKPVAQNILNRVNQINSRLGDIAKLGKNDDGFDVALPLNVADERQDLRNELRELNQKAVDLNKWVEGNGSKGSGGVEISIRHNLQLWPQLQKYEKQYRQCVASGMDCSDPHQVYDVCRAMYRRENPQPTRPTVSKADIEKQALQENLDRKQRGAITAGKTTGAKTAAAKAVPDAVKREMQSFSRYFHDEDED